MPCIVEPFFANFSVNRLLLPERILDILYLHSSESFKRIKTIMSQALQSISLKYKHVEFFFLVFFTFNLFLCTMVVYFK